MHKYDKLCRRQISVFFFVDDLLPFKLTAKNYSYTLKHTFSLGFIDVKLTFHICSSQIFLLAIGLYLIINEKMNEARF